MAISNEWTDTDDLEVSVGDLPRASWGNALLGNLQRLYAVPRVALADTNDHGNIDDGVDTQLEFNTVIQEHPGGFWTDGSFNDSVVTPRDGDFLICWRAMWDAEEGGTLRRLRILRDGDPIAGDPRYGHAFCEHSGTIVSAMDEGTSIAVDVRHNDSARQHAIISNDDPVWRSPLLIVRWIGPKGTSF